MTEEELQSQIKHGESEFRFTTNDSGGKKEDKNRGESKRGISTLQID